MRFILAAFMCLQASVALAAEPCSAGFCKANANGAQCSLNGQTNTCGNCAGGSVVLIKGDRTPADATAICECMYDKTKPCGVEGAPDQVVPMKTPTPTKKGG
jgi:hypothetical protein